MSQRLRSSERKAVYSDNPNQQLQNQFIYIEQPVNKEDTLIVFSMKFNVTIPELKRINSLLNDRDIYALSAIKIPIKPNSIFFHQFQDQLKYGDINMTRLTNRLDSSLERELADNKILNRGDEEYADEEDLDHANPTSFIGFTANGEQIMDTEFTNYEEDDTTALLLNHNNQEQQFNQNKQAKEAKKYLKKLDTNLESLKSQNQELINNVANKSASEQLIPMPNSSFSIENSPLNRTGMFSSRNSFNTPDILIIAVFFMILLPIVVIVYRYYFYYENGHNIPHSHPH